MTDLTQFLWKHCREDAERVIRSADAIAGNAFIFDTRWDMERTWEPVTFSSEIDWLHQPGVDPEWTFAFNRMKFWITLGQAYILTQDEKYAEAFVNQMTGWIKRVKKDDPANANAWRSIEAGFRLEYWLKAMRYFEKSPLLTDGVMSLFTGSVTEHAEYIMGVWNPFNLMSNWGTLSNHGLFMAGVYLQKPEYIAEAIKRLEQTIRIQVYNDGAHWEQSPMYHNKVLHCYMDVILLARQNNIVLPDIIINKTRKLCEYSMYSGKPDHNELCMGDSDEVDQRNLISMGAYLFNDEQMRHRGFDAPDFDTVCEMGLDGWEAYTAIKPLQPAETDRAFTDSGNFFFRDSWEPDASFVHFHCGTLGAGHGHADKLHFDVFSRGEDILVDAGRFSYAFDNCRAEFKALRAHNTVMVDGMDIYVQKNSWESTNLSRPVNRAFFADARYGYAEGGHTAYTDAGVFVNRRLIYIKPGILVTADEFYAAGTHKYERFFHFNNAGTLTKENITGEERFVYESGAVKAQAVFIGGTARIESSVLSRKYNRREENKAVTVEMNKTGFAGAFAVFAFAEAGDNERLSVEKLPVTSRFTSKLFADDVIEALSIQFGNLDYVLVIAHREYSCPTDMFSAGGCAGFGNAVIFDRASNEHQIGTVLLY